MKNITPGALVYTIRCIGADHWIFEGETMVLRLRGRNASAIRSVAEAYRMAGYQSHLTAYLMGVVAGAMFTTMVKIAEEIGEPAVRDPIPSDGGDVEARG